MSGTYKGFHGTCKSSAESIVENGFRCTDNPKHWLGRGVYFFLEYDLAVDWTKKVKHTRFGTKECSDPSPAVVHADINYDSIDTVVEIADQDDYDELERKLKEFNKILKVKAASRPLKSQFSDMERVRCMFFEWLHSEYKKNIFIVPFDKAKLDPYSITYSLKSFYIPKIEYQMCVFETSLIVVTKMEVLS